ncbi:hypothetical protein [Frankia sp. QA3]|uniref:hypothetical protein n=1 Tax=Frankia sp. QA3 TaxID=710111 RepID=UPI000269CB4A|nr:hypothetical protein [Frankia sp. QA3]EIV95305.1 hypothetical protein FraQA3DRAFT_5115 [Frankia sp. QA3]
MTVCGLVRLDGVDVRRAVLTTMLASSASGLPAARGVHTDGAFGAVSAADPDADPTPPIAVDDAGLVVIADHPPRAAGSRRSARASAAAYRAGGQWALLRPAAGTVTVVWEPVRARLVLARPSGAPTELVTWSDGRVFAFGTETDQVLSAAGGGLSRPARLRRLGSGEVLTVTVPARRHRPALAAVRPRSGAEPAPGLAPAGCP